MGFRKNLLFVKKKINPTIFDYDRMVFMIFRHATQSEELQTFPLRWRGVNVNFREAGIFYRIINCV